MQTEKPRTRQRRASIRFPTTALDDWSETMADCKKAQIKLPAQQNPNRIQKKEHVSK